jgi:hypothetical protein
VAVQLGLTDDAARLFSSCERWDLVEQLHQASGGWQEALQAATKHDRLVHFMRQVGSRNKQGLHDIDSFQSFQTATVAVGFANLLGACEWWLFTATSVCCHVNHALSAVMSCVWCLQSSYAGCAPCLRTSL